jgi:hypothetical protein
MAGKSKNQAVPITARNANAPNIQRLGRPVLDAVGMANFLANDLVLLRARWKGNWHEIEEFMAR